MDKKLMEMDKEGPFYYFYKKLMERSCVPVILDGLLKELGYERGRNGTIVKIRKVN